MFDLTTASVIFCLGLAAFFLTLWTYYDRRDHARFEAERRRTVFHCVRCDTVYAERGLPDASRCPRCRHENGRLRF
jgi:Zn finger protein HypA/HybF involved in hydrogenase expression